MSYRVSETFVARLRERIAYLGGGAGAQAELEAKYQGLLNVNNFASAMAALDSYAGRPDGGFAKREAALSLDVALRDSHRLTVDGARSILEFCKAPTLAGVERMLAGADRASLSLMRKTASASPKMAALPCPQFDFRLDVREEAKVDVGRVTKLFAPSWHRLKQRVSYTHASMRMRVDLTIVRASRNARALTRAEPSYEVEVEVLGAGADAQQLVDLLAEMYVLLAAEKFPVSSPSPIEAYLAMVRPAGAAKKVEEVMRRPKLFFHGPQPVTLEHKHLHPPGPIGAGARASIVDTHVRYCVTEKADGERMLLFADREGRVHLVNSRLQFLSAGRWAGKGAGASLLDGERIEVGPGRPTLYRAFDAYWVGGRDVRSLPLDQRLEAAQPLLAALAAAMDPPGAIDIKVKQFEGLDAAAPGGGDIFKNTKRVLSRAYPYKTDGVIFTPVDLPVGGSFKGDEQTNGFGKWARVLKWKPPEDNTIDFLVRVNPQRSEDGMTVLSLQVGTNTFTKPLEPADFITGALSRPDKTDGAGGGGLHYIAVPFAPPHSARESPDLCFLTDAEMVFDDGQRIADGTIVEFAYATQEPDARRRWKPYRIREDKTAMFRKTNALGGTANDFETAKSVWNTIHNPVTEAMVTGEQPVPEAFLAEEDGVYYTRRDRATADLSRAMREYHNFVKRRLLAGAWRRRSDASLFDFACGKGGDVQKWLDYNYERVVGVDYSHDNIANPVDGAYARLLRSKKYSPTRHSYVFSQFDASRSRRENMTASAFSPSVKSANEILFGPPSASGGALYGIAAGRFGVVSCQFALHYFCKDEHTLDAFLDNVDSVIRPGGYFVGTCLNGERVHAAFAASDDDSGILTSGDNGIWRIEKKYGGEDGGVGLGRVVSVFMNTIGQVIDEYLVDFALLIAKMEARGYGRVESGEDDGSEMFEFTRGEYRGSFADLAHVKNASKIRKMMSRSEMTYSDLNDWFVFKKITDDVTVTEV